VNKPQLHLASSSARRRELLSALGLSYTHAGVDLDETPLTGEPANAMVLRLALAKAQTAENSCDSDLPILGADTAVALDARVLGKPADREDALQMLALLSGRTHTVLTAVAIVGHGQPESALATSEVTFREIRPEEAAAYWDSGEPQGKAGAYAVQGIGGIFVQQIKGSYSAVVGLPIFETAKLLGSAGICLLQNTNHVPTD
jgi:septum formation protein